MLAMQNMPESQKWKKKKKTQTKNKKEISNRYIREHQQKNCLMLSRFMAVKGGEAFRGNPLKKENLWRKSVFQIMLYEALKISEKWYSYGMLM